MDDEKPRRKRRVNRKRRVLSIARNYNPQAIVWAVCLNTEKDLWRSFVIDAGNKTLIHSGDVVKGRNNAYGNLHEKLEKG